MGDWLVLFSTGLRRMAIEPVVLLALFDGMGPVQVGQGCATNGASAERGVDLRGGSGRVCDSKEHVDGSRHQA